MASPFLWPVLVPSALRAPAPVNLGVRPIYNQCPATLFGTCEKEMENHEQKIMSRKDMSEMTKPSPGEKLQSLGKRFLLNFTFFIISSINSFTIRSDGPSGFGEVFIKILIFIVSVAALLASTISLTLIERSESRRKGAEVT